ncbi:hypothetical protein YC2023_020663 [Brassica napus]
MKQEKVFKPKSLSSAQFFEDENKSTLDMFSWLKQRRVSKLWATNIIDGLKGDQVAKLKNDAWDLLYQVLDEKVKVIKRN